MYRYTFVYTYICNFPAINTASVVLLLLLHPSNNLSGGPSRWRTFIEVLCTKPVFHSCEASCSATEIEAGVKESGDVLQS